jgi:hypothetical protein
MHYTDYGRRLLVEHATFAIEPAWVEIGPLHNPTILPSSPPWNMDWAILFPDGKYAYAKERWYPASISRPRGANWGHRQHFSFHYGTANPARDSRGIPLPDNIHFPAVIRIDKDQWGPHLHFGGENHIPQTRIQGMTIEDADPFDFMRAVLEHRTTGANFDAVMNFQVTP